MAVVVSATYCQSVTMGMESKSSDSLTHSSFIISHQKEKKMSEKKKKKGGNSSSGGNSKPIEVDPFTGFKETIEKFLSYRCSGS